MGRRPRLDRDRALGEPRPGAEQRQHRPAEAAAHDARAERARLAGRPRPPARPPARRPRSRRAGCGARRRAGARARRGRPPPSAATAASTRSFSETTWRTRRSSGSGSAATRRRRRRRAASRRRAPGRRRGTPRGARCSPSRRRGRARRPSRAWPAGGRRARAARSRAAGRACRCAARARGSEQSTASWSSRPVCAPVHSFSMREHRRASSTRSGGVLAGDGAERQADRHAHGRRRGQARAARQVRVDLQAAAAQRDPAGRELGGRAAHERAPAVGRLGGWPSAKRSCSSRSSARASIASPVERLGRHPHAALDRERQAEAVVVVGVLADQVDPPRGECLDTAAARACSY